MTTTDLHVETLPFLTDDIAPVKAAIKRHYEDFVVQEIPAYQPCGEGTHCYFTIEKRGLATMRAVHDIAQKLGVPRKDIGMAGLKDARAVTTQTLSIEHIDPARIENLDIPRIKILSVSRHKNKLKVGHLAGNRFQIKLREVDIARVPDVRTICEALNQKGVPNYFGQQRFGSRGDTWQLGHALLAGDYQTLIDLMLGRPGPYDTGDVLKARQLYEAGDYATAAKTWPYSFRDNGRACRAMVKSRGNHKRAFHTLDTRLKNFFVNAYQSHLYNMLLAKRIKEIDRVVTGDLAYKHDSGAVFLVEDASVEAPRAESFAISPTGPLFGYKMTQPQGEPSRMEQEVLDAQNITLDVFNAGKGMKVHGSRRPLRFQPKDLTVDAGVDENGPYIELAFSLPAGCYATVLLREICKGELEEGLVDETASGDTE